MKSLGIFWMPSNRIRLDAEGIGRYCVRLAEGLLRKREDTTVTIAANPANAADIAKIFFVVKTAYPQRLDIIVADNLHSVNRNINVDMWIVPYIGLGEAPHLYKPYVVCIHDLYYVHFPEVRGSLQIAYLDSVAKQVAAKAAAAVFNSDYIRQCEGLSYLGLFPEKTCVIPLAPPGEEYKIFGLRDETAFRRQYGLDSGYITYPSAIRLTKNHFRLLNAFNNFKQSEVGKRSEVRLILTDNPRRILSQQEYIAMEAECRKHGIYFFDRLPSSDMPSLYKYSIGTIVPTLFEGSCPFPILESLAMERPVAFSRIEVAQELIPAWNEFITFDPYSVEDIARGIRELCNCDPGLAVRQKAAIGKVLSRTWQDVAADYYDLMARVLP